MTEPDIQEKALLIFLGMILGVGFMLILLAIIGIDSQMVGEEMLHNICREFTHEPNTYADLDHSTLHLICYHEDQKAIELVNKR